MLRIGGYINIIIAIAHILGLFWAEQMFAVTGVNEEMKQLSEIHYSLPYLLTVIVAIIFFIFGFYGLSADGRFRKLPYLKFGIFTIAGIYLFRAIGEQSYSLIQETTTISETIQSVVALVIGFLFLVGGLKKWNKVTNIHKRIIDQPKEKVSELFRTLATENDKILATDKWSPMRLNNGKKEGSKGGHGPIRYTVQKYIPDEYIQFRFTQPKGFNGIHEFEITELEKNKTEIKHSIEMNTTGTAIFIWSIAIHWLHNAFMEDAFDKVENHFLTEKKETEWSLWVKILRRILKPKKIKNVQQKKN